MVLTFSYEGLGFVAPVLAPAFFGYFFLFASH